MKDNYRKCLEIVLDHEGGFVDHPRDPGGATNLGITQSVYEDYVGHAVTIQDMRDLTIEDVEPIYHDNYWKKIRGDDLPMGVDLTVFDFAVNSGVNRASRYLQKVVKAKVDGIIGTHTLALTEAMKSDRVIDDLLKERLEFLKTLSHYDDFKRGWLRRLGNVHHEAFKMI